MKKLQIAGIAAILTGITLIVTSNYEAIDLVSGMLIGGGIGFAFFGLGIKDYSK